MNDLLEVRFNLLGTAEDEGFEACEAAFTELVGEGNGGFVFLLIVERRPMPSARLFKATKRS